MPISEMRERIIALAKDRGLSQRDLARACGVSEAAISYYINGNRNMSVKTLIKMASALNTTMGFLLFGDKTGKV